MYRPAANVVDDEVGWQILAGCRAGHLVTATGALDASFVPFLVDAEGSRVLATSHERTRSGVGPTALGRS